MPHHTSATHKPMPLYNRAAQFSPFAALTGFEDIISEAAERQAAETGDKEDVKDFKETDLDRHLESDIDFCP